MAVAEGGEEEFPLVSVFVAFCEEDPAGAEDAADAAAHEGGFDEEVAFGVECFAEGFRGAEHDAFGIEEAAVADQAVVGDGLHPLELGDAGGVALDF